MAINEFYTNTNIPQTGSPGASAPIRDEYELISRGFAKLPVMQGRPNRLVMVNQNEESLGTSNFPVTDIVLLNAPQTLTNKTISLDLNSFPGMGTAARANVGLNAGNVPALVADNTLPALDATNLYNINDPSLAKLDSPFFIGNPRGPTPNQDDDSASLATTHFVMTGLHLKANLASPAFTGHPTSVSPLPSDRSNSIATMEAVWGIAETFADSTVFTGIPTVPTPLPEDNSKQIVNTEFVVGLQGTALPLGDQVVAKTGVSRLYAREDHIHPISQNSAPASAATAVGTSFPPTQTMPVDNVWAALELLDGRQLSATGAPLSNADPLPGSSVASPGTSNAVSRADHVHPVPDSMGMLPGSMMPLMAGTGQVGISAFGSREDHQHPINPGIAMLDSPQFIGIPLFPTAPVNTNSMQAASTAFVVGQASGQLPVDNGARAVGTSLRYARADHIHQTDSTRAPLDSPTFAGIVRLATAPVDTNTTQAASTAFVLNQAGTLVPGMDGTAKIGNSTLYARQDHIHPTDTTRASVDDMNAFISTVEDMIASKVKGMNFTYFISQI